MTDGVRQEHRLLEQLQEIVFDLPFWRDSPSPATALLSAIDYWHVERLTRQADLPRHRVDNINWLNQCGVAMEWCRASGQPATPRSFLAGDRDRDLVDPVVEYLRTYVEVEAALWKTTYYGYSMNRDAECIQIRAPQDCAVEALDMALDFLHPDPSYLTPPSELLDELDAVSRLAEPLRRRHDVPAKTHFYTEFVSATIGSMLAGLPQVQLEYLHQTDSIQGCRVGNLIDTWQTLRAWMEAELFLATALGFIPANVRNASIEDLARMVADSHPQTSAIEARRAIQLFCFDPDSPARVEAKDHALLPLYLVNADHVLVPFSAVLCNLPERLLLRLAGQKTDEFGTISHRLDEAGSLVESITKAVHEPLLARPGIGYYHDGKKGDFDVVVISPESRTGIIIEVASGIGPASGPEFLQLFSKLCKKMENQVPRNQRALRSGDAKIDWPAGWPAIDEITWTWGISGLDYAGLKANHRSSQLLSRNQLVEVARNLIDRLLAPQRTLAELIAVIESPPPVPHQIINRTYVLGDFTIEVDQLIVR